MPVELGLYKAALEDFFEARQQAALQEIIAHLTGKSNELLSYEDVARRLKLGGRAERGVREIPVSAVVGSMGRYTDFTRTFLPRQDNDRQRWANVMAASKALNTVLPPIEVYQVGEVYFVLDGNHRVSVARQAGATHIEAHVIEVHTPIQLTPDLQPDDLIVKAEYAEFLEQTRLADLRPGVNLTLTAPGQYAKLKEQIEVHRYYMQSERPGEVSLAEAAGAWYDEVYQPMALAICDRGLLRWFPKRTETDLYLWVSEHRAALEKELGWAIRPEAAVADLAVRKSAQAESHEAVTGSWRKAKITDRYTERLFKDLLVPLNGSPESWPALEQAIVIARREGAQLQGLHLAGSEAQKEQAPTLSIQSRFDQACAAANVPGSLVIERGEVTRKICERALLADLVVLNVAHPPVSGLPSLSSGLRNIIWRCARPILAVPGKASRLDRALLAYDGSPKAKEALFVATYLAERWQTSLSVIAILDGNRVGPSVLDYARNYLDLHEIQAEFILSNGPIDALVQTIVERQLNLAIIGGYSVSALEEIMGGGSAVNYLLREAPCPLLICR